MNPIRLNRDALRHFSFQMGAAFMMCFVNAEINHLITKDWPLHDETKRALGASPTTGTAHPNAILKLAVSAYFIKARGLFLI